MRQPKYRVELSEEERTALEALIRKGKSSARIPLKAQAGLTSQDIGEALDVSAETIYQVRQGFVEEGLEVALDERPRPGQRSKLTDRQCAHVIAIACSAAPQAHDH